MDEAPRKHVIIVEDDRSIARYLSQILDSQGFDTTVHRTGSEARTAIAAEAPDVVVLDLGLPDMDGVDLLKEIRQWSQVPVVVVTARDQERDMIRALDAGADDYVMKPFRVGELLARLRAAMRRFPQTDETGHAIPERFHCNEITIDLASRLVFRGSEEVRLTQTEYRLLEVLVKNHGRVMTLNQLQANVWGAINPDQQANVRVVVSSVRRKLAPHGESDNLIRTEVGVGYRLRTCESDES